MELPPLTLQLVAMLGICVAALLLFIWNRLPFELVGLMVLAALMVFGLLPLSQALSGFSNEAVLTVAGLLLLSVGLQQTGAVEMLAEAFARTGPGSAFKFMIVLIIFIVPVSAFLNNTAVVAILIPVVLDAARHYQIAPSKLLIPLSFSSQLGGTLTLIGSSTNLLVSGVMVELGEPGFGFFQMTGAATVLMLAGVVYLLTIGWRLLPDRGALEDGFHVSFRRFDSALVVEPDSAFVGSSFRQVRENGFEDLQLKAIQHAATQGELGEDAPLRAGDVLFVEGPSDALKRADRTAGLRFAIPGKERRAVARDEPVVVEAVIAPRSRLIGRKVRDLGPPDLHGGAMLAVQRHGRQPGVRTPERALRAGDLVLVEGGYGGLNRSHESGLLFLVSRVELEGPRDRWWLAAGIMLAVILLAALDVLPMSVSVLLGVIAMTVTGCLKLADAYERMDWSVIILIASIIPLGSAMQQTGAAQLLAALVIGATGDLGPYIVLGTLYLLTSLLTELISNNAAAVILTPVAVAVANALGVSPVPFAMAVMMAASNSFMTPIGYQTNTLIYGPGAYEFRDFIRVGAPLSLLLVPIAVVVLPLFFPF